MKFEYADIYNSNFDGSNLEEALIWFVSIYQSSFKFAKLTNTTLYGSSIINSSFQEAEFQNTKVGKNSYSNINFTGAKFLESCQNRQASSIDFITLQTSWPLPRKFLQGIGLPDTYIDYLPSLFDNDPFQFYTCFISYYHEDQEFAEKLHDSLQAKGVRVWLDKHDMPIGGRIRNEIDEQIRQRDKVILVLSDKTMQSKWVKHEVNAALDEEVRRDTDILMPITIDDSVFDRDDDWITRLKETRSIGDFKRWKEHDEYRKSFEFLMRWLKSEKA